MVSPDPELAIDTASELVDAIRRTLRHHRGAATPQLRAIRRLFSRFIVHMPGTVLLTAANALVESGSFHERFLGYELIANHDSARSMLSAPTLHRLGGELGSWAAVDTFSCYLAGPAWRTGQISDRVIHRWARSRSRWWRRAALVATVPLNVPARGGTGDAARTVTVCALLVADRDDMVVKGLSWALRALVARDAPAVRRFLAAHRTALPPRVLREVETKLATGRKAFRRDAPKKGQGTAGRRTRRN